jgi:hypothetical protein
MADEQTLKGQLNQTDGKAPNAVRTAAGENNDKDAAKHDHGKNDEDWARLRDAIRSETDRKRAEREADRR